MLKIYKYIDQKGILFIKLINISIRIQEDDFVNRFRIESDETANRIIKKGELIISTHSDINIIEHDFPNKFKLDKKEQKETALNWLKDTTGYFVNEFKTLFELSELNCKPFLLQVERGENNYFLVLATQIIDGDLTIRENIIVVMDFYRRISLKLLVK